MRRLLAICLSMSLGVSVTPALASKASQQAAKLIKQGYERDMKRCKAKWKALLKLCQAHPDPNVGNNCGIPLPTTTSTTTTTTTSEPTTTSVACTTSSTTTTLGCDPQSRVWTPCGPPDKGCSCHHFPGGPNYQFICVEAGVQAQPTYLPCIQAVVCNTDQDCRDCLNDETNPNIVCIKGQDEPPRGACVDLCP